MEHQKITLYKFHKLNLHLIQLLTFSQFYSCSRKELNDPFDLNIRLSDEFIIEMINNPGSMAHDAWMKYSKMFPTIAYFDQISSAKSSKEKLRLYRNDSFYVKQFNDFLVDEMGYRIISFTSNDELIMQLPMWAHYASMNGVLLKFEFPLKDWQNYGPTPEKVKYVSSLPVSRMTKELRLGLLYKLNPWKHEKEYRIISCSSNSQVNFHKSQLKELIFGLHVSPGDRYLIQKMLGNLNYECRIGHLKIVDNMVEVGYADEDFLSKMKDSIPSSNITIPLD